MVKTFITPERNAAEQAFKSRRGLPLIASCRSGKDIAKKIASAYNRLLKETGSELAIADLHDVDFQFSFDKETCARIKTHVSGYDVYLVQCLYDPTSPRSIDENLMGLLTTISAFKENGANHITVIMPYHAYGRQDKPSEFERESTTAALMAKFIISGGTDRVITYHAHALQIRGFYPGIATNFIRPDCVVAEEFSFLAGSQEVIVIGPDEGSVDEAAKAAKVLNLSYGHGDKDRINEEEVNIREIVGDFRGKTTALIVDDIISSAGTLYKLILLLLEKGIKTFYIYMSHCLCSEKAKERLLELKSQGVDIKLLITTNSIPQAESWHAELGFTKIICLSEILARVINRVHFDTSASELFPKPKSK